MKIFVVFCSLFFMCQVWALGSRRPGVDPANTDAMGGSAAALNQVTPEENVDPATLEEQEEQQMQQMEEQQKSPEDQLQEEEIEQSRYDVVPDH